MANQFDFLHSYINTLLDESGFEEMSEETRNQYIPMFVAEAERRLGIALLPMLSAEQTEELANKGKDENITAEALADFWAQAIPDFKKIVEKTLTEFAVEFKKTLKNVA